MARVNPTATHHSDLAPAPVSFRTALRYWFKLGCISFGGPAGQIALMHSELVERRRWLSEKRFLHALNYCMLLPGPEAQQLATYIGWLMHRTWGGIAAGVLFVLPSLVLLIALSALYVAYGTLPIVAAIFYGIKPAVCAVVLQAAHRIGSRTLRHPLLVGIAVMAFVGIFALHVPFPLIVLLAALIGLLAAPRVPGAFTSGGHAGGTARVGRALLDDDTPIPAHAHFSWPRFTVVLAIGAALWLVPVLALWTGLGAQHTLTVMALFFTKAALLTFGGAYAVLPYVMQASVNGYGWLSPRQMMDGLALGETTPGPLIMVVAFVAFLGGHSGAVLAPHAFGGALSFETLRFAGGAMAAVLVCWFTFLPSFVFILAGGPLVESSQNTKVFTAPLTAITAAVVGVIANLAIFFVLHTLWPSLSAVTSQNKLMCGNPDLVALMMILAAATALVRFKIGVVKVLVACALCGVALLYVTG
jgi:chromate transporter